MRYLSLVYLNSQIGKISVYRLVGSLRISLLYEMPRINSQLNSFSLQHLLFELDRYREFLQRVAMPRAVDISITLDRLTSRGCDIDDGAPEPRPDPHKRRARIDVPIDSRGTNPTQTAIKSP